MNIRSLHRKLSLALTTSFLQYKVAHGMVICDSIAIHELIQIQMFRCDCFNGMKLLMTA